MTECCCCAFLFCFFAFKVLSKVLGGVQIRLGQQAGPKAVSHTPTGFKQTDQSPTWSWCVLSVSFQVATEGFLALFKAKLPNIHVRIVSCFFFFCFILVCLCEELDESNPILINWHENYRSKSHCTVEFPSSDFLLSPSKCYLCPWAV